MWTESDKVKQWWGPDHFTCPLGDIDFREGGTSLVCMRSKEYGDQYSIWRYTKIAPMKRIEYILNLADKDGNKIEPASIGMPAEFPQDLLNIVTFEDLGNGRTKITVTEKDWPVGQMMEMSRMGEDQCLDKMAKALENMSKNVLKSVGAVLAGFIFIGVTHTGTDAILESIGVLPKDNLFVGTGLILIVIGYRAVFSLIGCYLTARLAPQNPVRHTLALGVVGVLLSTVGAIATVKMNLGPAWYAWTLVAISLPVAWLGGKLYEARSH